MIQTSGSTTAAGTKRRYTSPSIIAVGSIDSITAGSGTPVGDPPNDGTTGYFNSATIQINGEVELGNR